MMETAVSRQRNNGEDLPEDFPERLELFREEAGLTWGELAASMGVDHERLMSLRRGGLPRDLMLPKLMQLAHRVPGGMEALFPNVVNTLGAGE